MEFRELVEKLATQQERTVLEGTLLAIDPGETTGFALFEGLELIDCWQYRAQTLNESFSYIHEFIQANSKIQELIYEDYRVYGDKTESHAWNELFTPKLIGAIEALAYIAAIPANHIWAYQHKKFCTDDKLNHWGFYELTKGTPHARDAVRIGAYHLIFGKETTKF